MVASHFDLAQAWDSSWEINGKSAKRKVGEHVGDSVVNRLHSYSGEKCPYCTQVLHHKAHRHYESDESGILEEPIGEPLTRHYILSHCIRCSYWIINGYEGGPDCLDSIFLMSAASITAKFATASPHGCSEELAQHLRRKPELWHYLAPRRMETLVADIFKANHQHCEVKHVGGPGDLGIDVIFIDDNSTKWLIQVKRRERPNKAEGFSTLQSILGTMALQGERHGIIVSTADYFSYQAKREAKNAAKQGFTIELIDKGILDRLVGGLLPQAAWKSVFTHPDVASTMRDLQDSFSDISRDTVGIGNVYDIAAQANEPHQESTFVDPNQLSLFT